MKRAEGGQTAVEVAASFHVVHQGKACDRIPQRCANMKE